MVKLSRDPAIYLSLIATAVRLAVAFGLDLTDGQQALVNAGATAIAGGIVAVWVRRDGQLAAGVAVIQALLALAIGFGLHIGPDQQAIIMSFVGLAAAAFVRTQVTAPVSADGIRPV